MLQVTFKNLIPSEQLIGIAHAGYRQLRRRAGCAGNEIHCYVTVHDRQRGAPDSQQYRVEVEVFDEGKAVLKTQAQGSDAHTLLGHSMLSASMAAAAPREHERSQAAPMVGRAAAAVS